MKATVNLGAAIETHYDRKNGKQYGLTVGLVFAKKVEWREIVFIKTKPCRYLSCELNLVGIRQSDHPVLGELIQLFKRSYCGGY